MNCYANVGLLAIQGGDKSDASPQRPQSINRTPSTTTTTTTTTTSAPQVVDTRPYCPGTCMAPILSFSCFSKFPRFQLNSTTSYDNIMR